MTPSVAHSGDSVSRKDYDKLAASLKAKESAFEKQVATMQKELDAERQRSRKNEQALMLMSGEIEDMKTDALLNSATHEVTGGHSASEKELQMQLKRA